jgi:pyruvate ferredoxin oxidoreductase alpha subunit
VREFLPGYDSQTGAFRGGKPMSQAVAVLGGSAYSYFRYETHLAADNALAVYDEASEDFARCFGRRYDSVESYRCEDAETAFVMIGSFSTKAKEAVDRLRDAGRPVGLVRPRLLRPFPTQALRRALASIKVAVVVDQNLAPGRGGILYTEVASALYDTTERPVLVSAIGGLGGRDISLEELFRLAEEGQRALVTGVTPPPRLLYTAAELAELRKLQAIARAEPEQRGSLG